MTNAIDFARIRSEIRRLEYRTRRSFSSDLLGAYQSAFRGHGLEYADSREYQPGDELRHIYWRASARTGKTYVKTYREERRLSMVVALDISRSTQYARHHDQALRFAAILALLSQKSRDAFGVCLFSSSIEEYLPPSRSRSRFQHSLGLLLSAQPRSPATDLAPVFRELQGVLRRPTVVVVISDCVSPPFQTDLRRLSTRHEVVCSVPVHPLDRQIPFDGLLEFEDAEGSGRLQIDAALPLPSKEWLSGAASQCLAARADFLAVSADPLMSLRRLFSARMKSRGGAVAVGL